jgi:hypothetical protein
MQGSSNMYDVEQRLRAAARQISIDTATIIGPQGLGAQEAAPGQSFYK